MQCTQNHATRSDKDGTAYQLFDKAKRRQTLFLQKSAHCTPSSTFYNTLIADRMRLTNDHATTQQTKNSTNHRLPRTKGRKEMQRIINRRVDRDAVFFFAFLCAFGRVKIRMLAAHNTKI